MIVDAGNNIIGKKIKNEIYGSYQFRNNSNKPCNKGYSKSN